MNRKSHGFTIIELLVVVAVIALLIAILLPSLGKARNKAKQAASASAIRQLLIGYRTYAQENDDMLLLGYPPAYINGTALSVTLPSGHAIPGPGSFAGSLSILRYPARMAPYENNVWKIMYQDNNMPTSAPVASDTMADASYKAYLLSISPSYGLNSVFLGGDFAYSGFTGSTPNFRANMGGPAVFRGNEVRRPSQMIVFVEAKQRNQAMGITTGEAGMFRATPPVAGGRKWRVVNNKFEVLVPDDVGIPEGRWGSSVVTGFFDGHAETIPAAELDDMRLWSNKANSVDEDNVP